MLSFSLRVYYGVEFSSAMRQATNHRNARRQQPVHLVPVRVQIFRQEPLRMLRCPGGLVSVQDDRLVRVTASSVQPYMLFVFLWIALVN